MKQFLLIKTDFWNGRKYTYNWTKGKDVFVDVSHQ